MIIIYERIMGQWKDDKRNGQGIFTWLMASDMRELVQKSSSAPS